MFWPDVIDLKLFYASPLGTLARAIIERAILKIWPSMPDECLLGIGFSHPYLEPYREQAGRVLALMPAAQGAVHWPVEAANLTFLGDEAELPFDDQNISRVLLVHSFENTEQLRHMLREIWRVLAPGGRVLVVVPNRRGVWARAPRSPFAHGSPFSAPQLRAVLRDNQFTPYHSHYALFTPPSQKGFVLKSFRLFESIGARFFTGFGGVVLMEAEKQIYAPSTQTVVKKRRNQIYNPSPQPAMSRTVTD